MSNPHSIPEFLGIIAGAIIVMSIIGVVIGTAYEGVKNKLKTNSEKTQSPKSNQKASIKKPKIHETEIKPKKPKTIVDIIVTDINLIQQDPIRYMTGSPGEVTRVLTQIYYRHYFNNIKTCEKALEFLEYRTGTINAITDTEINEDSLKSISNKYYNKISTLIFFLCYHENFFGEFDIFKEEYVSDLYEIITEEHNKVCPIGQEETNEFNMELFLNIKNIYSKYNSVYNSSNTVGFEIFDEYGENDRFDFDDQIDDVDEVIYNFEDIDIDKSTVIKCINEFEKIMIKIIEEFIPENPMKNTPLEAMGILNQMQETSTELNSQLVNSKIKFGFNDREIDYIISKIYNNVHLKFIKP
jgi:hypothetical protein